MSELRESLDQAMRTVAVGEPPVDAAMRRGKAIRRRRRVTVIASALTVAAVAGAGYPALAHRQAAPAPPVTRHHAVVTDVPPAPGSAPGVVAEGKVGSESWQVFVTKPENLGATGTQQCLYAKGSAFNDTSNSDPSTATTSLDCGPDLAPGTDPVTFTAASEGANQVQLGAVAADVTYVVVALGDGQQLKLIPVRVYGTRLVAFVAPVGTGVASATAVLDNGQTRTAIPANLPGVQAVFGLWLRPGQPAQGRATAVIAAGAIGGRPWSVTAYVGPWGTCFTGIAAGESACAPVAPMTTTGVVGYAGNPPQVVYGSVAAAVSYLLVTLTDGHTFRVEPVTIGDEKLFAFALAKGQPLHRWTAYDAAGHPLSSGGL